jgi:hypothetical protein
MELAVYAAHIGTKRNAYRISMGKQEGKTLLGRPRHIWEDNIELDIRVVGCSFMDWTNLAQHRDQ